MAKIKVQDFLWGLTGIVAIIWCMHTILVLSTETHTRWLIMLSVGGGIFLGVALQLPETLISRQMAGMLLILCLGIFVLLKLWPGVVGDMGLSIFALVICAGHFWRRFSEYKQSSN